MFITNLHVWYLILRNNFFIFETMITEEEYQAEVYKIAGFALMSPMGKLVLDVPGIDFSNLNFQFFIYVGLCTLLFFIGFIMILNGYGIVYAVNRKGKKWI